MTKETKKEQTTEVDFFVDDTGIGVDDLSQKDVELPQLHVLQKSTPFVERDHEAYVEGAFSGDFLVDVQNKIYDGKEGIYFIPINRVTNYAEFVKKDEKSKKYEEFVRIMDRVEGEELEIDAVYDADARMLITKNGTGLQKRDVFLAIVYGADETPDQGIMVKFLCKNTALNFAKKLKTNIYNTTVQGTSKRAPMFYNVYKIAIKSKTDNGNTWNVPVISSVNVITDLLGEDKGREIFSKCKDTRDATQPLLIAASTTDTALLEDNSTKTIKGETEDFIDDDIPF